MRAVVQRVACASVRVGDRVVGAIGSGLAVLLGVARDDDDRDAAWMAEKIANLRIFRDEDGLMNRDVTAAGGAILLISQFTLLGDARKGRRPSFAGAAPEQRARALYALTGRLLEQRGLSVAYGEFGATMRVELINDGPVTILLDSTRLF